MPRLVAIAAVAVCVLGSVPLASAATQEAPRQAKPAAPSKQHSAGADKSFAVYVGKNLTENKHTFLGGFGHEPSSHWVDIVPHRKHPPGSTIQVGATDKADMPGKLTRIPQAPETARYISSDYSEFVGFPAPLTNGGLNEYGVAARDVWSDSRTELVDQTPKDQTGPNYSDLSRIAMERAHSAREAARIVGSQIDKYGYTTYGGNSHLFADANEGWVLIEFSGGKGLWAAQRLGPDDVRVSYPGYIDHFPADWQHDPNFMASPNLISYAQERGWWQPGTDFDPQKVYGTPFPGKPVAVGKPADPEDPSPYRNPPSLEAEFRELKPVRLQDVMRIVRDPRWSDDRSGYGQVAELDNSVSNRAVPGKDLSKLWLATTAAVTAPYIPIYLGTQSIPPEYRQHRYLTHGASEEYLDPQFAEQEATESATQTYKRLMYATCARPKRYLDEVTKALEGYEAQILRDQGDVEQQAREQFSSGDAAGARATLTEASTGWAENGLELGDYLLDKELAGDKAEGGIHKPKVTVPEGETMNPESSDMSLRSEETARDRMNCDLGGGWADGGTLARKGHYGDPADVPDYRGSEGNWWPYALTGAGGLLIGGIAVWLVRRRVSRS
ncbi:C69 family dipeptidase [Sciscionella marina]|uniref:C69 family dipeptidase n=1 Tax=Sciscionella marina TaxID=508770 RepID=UPI0003744DA8|nr:C69 family dipeptidase [Sciscionella marina]